MSYNNIELTQMTVSDLNQISSNLIYEFDDFWNESTLKNELKNEYSYYIVAKSTIDSEIVGFAGLKIVLDNADIMNIVTKKSKRNLGIAQLMLQELINISKEKNVKTITLEVNYKNKPAIHLYEKFNFKQIAIRKNYYSNTDDAIIMQLMF